MEPDEVAHYEPSVNYKSKTIPSSSFKHISALSYQSIPLLQHLWYCFMCPNFKNFYTTYLSERIHICSSVQQF